MSAALPPFKGLVTSLIFTHNTLISILYLIINSPDSRYIRCCDHQGSAINKGAQFRDGLDSQYGDVIFLMKTNFWQGMKGVHYSNESITRHIFAGHVHHHDFIEYTGEGNVNLVDRWLEQDARLFDFRRPLAEGMHVGNGKECTKHDWAFSWCNTQIHIGDNVGFEHVEKVYVPAWIVYDNETIAQIEKKGVNTTMLQLLVTNRLPFYPTGDHASNPLNGLFHLYGPRNAHEHYYVIAKERHKIMLDGLAHAVYEPIHPKSSGQQQSTPTHRHSARSSSTVFLDENTFVDLEVRYMADLISRNMTMHPHHMAHNISQLALYQFD